MKTGLIGVAATALMVVAGPLWAGNSSSARPDPKDGLPGTNRAAELIASASAALGQGDAARAVQDAEAATLLVPGDAGTRALLGRAYLAAGRFRSADTAFGDALTLDPSLARITVSHALAQIALGHPGDARASLAKAEGIAPDADIGLALALLGDADSARQRLNSAARAAGADARARQNLGLAYALEGRWTDAVAVAEQDVPPDQMPQRLRRWAMIAQLKADPAMQVGAVLGVLPTADAGQPAALALAAPSPAPTVPVVLANTVAQPSPASMATPVVHREKGATVTQTSVAPPPLAALAAVRQPAVVISKVAAWTGPPKLHSLPVTPEEPAGPSPAHLGAQVSKEPKPVKTAFGVAPVTSGPTAAKPLLLASRVSPKPSPAKAMGQWAVQLGAFSSTERTQVAWGKLSGKAAFLGTYTPTGAGVRWGKAMLYRLSVSGLSTRQEAVGLCLRIRTSGGTCFVRAARGDRPLQWALRAHQAESA